MRNLKRLAVLGLLTAMSGSLHAQKDAPAESVPLAELVPAQRMDIEHYRIGIAGEEVPEVLRVHLGLPEGTGLVIRTVLNDSPADLAGLRQHDVILEANGVEVVEMVGLANLVKESNGAEMAMTIISRGEHKVIRVTPELMKDDPTARRPLEAPPAGFADLDQLPPDVRKRFEQFDQMFQLPGGAIGLGGLRGFGRLLPGIAFDEEDFEVQNLPNNFSMQIEKTDDAPAKVKVQRGNEAWEVTEDNIDELPADLQPLVRNMLSGNHGVVSGLALPRNRNRALERRIPRREMDERVDGIELQIKELTDAIKSMQRD